MGQEKLNGGGGFDVATNEYYVEFHRRLVVPREIYMKVIRLLEEGNYDEATSVVSEVENFNSNDKAFIRFAFDQLKKENLIENL